MKEFRLGALYFNLRIHQFTNSYLVSLYIMLFYNNNLFMIDYASMGTWFIGNHWDTQKSLQCLSPTTPLLVIHGENDEIIPLKHGKELFEEFAVHPDLKVLSIILASFSHPFIYRMDFFPKIVRIMNIWSLSTSVSQLRDFCSSKVCRGRVSSL